MPPRQFPGRPARGDRGLHLGPDGDVPPTGKVITMRAIDILRVESGRITACTSLWDGLSVYEQLGLLPDDLL